MPEAESPLQPADRGDIGPIGWVIVALVSLAWGGLTLRLSLYNDLILSSGVAIGAWLALLVGRVVLAPTQVTPWVRALVWGAGIVALLNVASLIVILVALANRTGP